ncbi:MAG: 16S rRNA (adenine(1518)-N(6)/adenine(1519)-N(6))-dimethyltransferase RsmA [Acidobacteriaceae bacterium]
MPKKPKLGQNFLISPTAPRAIVDALGNIADACVLEIGPGRGAITHLLANRARRLIAVEYDPVLAATLRRSYASRPAIEIRSASILDVNLEELARQEGKLCVVGNLPYYLTSDILLHLFRHALAIDRAVLMVQREVADRITASPGSRDYGLLTATAQLYGTVEPLLTLPPEAFSPPPDVFSTVFRMFMQPRFEELGVSAEGFIPFLRLCFAQKRKTLANNLRSAGFPADAIASAMNDCGLHPQVRAEAVPLEETACLLRGMTDRSSFHPEQNPGAPS